MQQTGMLVGNFQSGRGHKVFVTPIKGYRKYSGDNLFFSIPSLATLNETLAA